MPRDRVVRHVFRDQDLKIQQLALRMSPAQGVAIPTMAVRAEALRRGIAALEAELDADDAAADLAEQSPPPQDVLDAPVPPPSSSKWSTLVHRPPPPRS